MNETIRLMKSHFSVRRFKEEAIKEADLKEILSAGQMASSWKNFQSYSVVVVKSREKNQGKERSSLRLASSRSDSPIRRLSSLCWGFKPR